MNTTFSNFELTHHSKTRAAQRAISDSVLEFMLNYGEVREQKGGTCVMALSRRDRKCLVRDLKKLLRVLTNDRPTYAVVGERGHVITLGHEYK